MIMIGEIPSNAVVTLYSEDIKEEFVHGFLIIYDEEELVLACVDHYGENDGYMLLKRKGVYRIDFGSSYEKRIECLYYLKKQKHETIMFCKKDFSLIDDLLYWAFIEKKTVTMGFFDDSCEVNGYLEDLTHYKISIIDPYECKSEQGSTYVVPQKANYIRIDSRRTRDAEMVYQYKGNAKNE